MLNQTQRPASLCYPAAVLCWIGSVHISAGSTSHGKPLLDQILFKYFALFTVASSCALGLGVDEQLQSRLFGRLVTCVDGNADWWKRCLLLHKWEEGVVCPVNQ